MINVALVGCGYWGPNLLRNFAQAPGVSRLVCCDRDPAKLEKAGRLFPAVATTTEFDDVLMDAEIDAVAIATPVRTHFALARRALLAGKHTFVEKPLAMSSEECRVLIDLAERRGKVLMVGHTFMYNPAVLKVKEMADPEYLGDIYYLYSHRMNLGQVQTDINALWSIAPHDISIALFLIDGYPVEVAARGASYLGTQVEDVVFLTLTFSNGAIAHVHVSWIDPSKTRKVTVVGSKRMIIYDDLADEGKVKVYDKGVYRVDDRDDGRDTYGEFHYRLHSGDIYAPRVRMAEPLAEECGHFIDCIVHGKQPFTDGYNGLAVVQVLEAAQRSLERNGMPVLVDEGGAEAGRQSLAAPLAGEAV